MLFTTRRTHVLLNCGSEMQHPTSFGFCTTSSIFVNADTDGTAIYVGNIPWSTTEDQLKEFMELAGTVSKVIIVKDKETGQPKGFTFVYFEDDESATKAVNLFNGEDFFGRAIRVNFANKKTR
ncbi:hypothetical protein PRIPAC_72164 [Pristionchus pacificus]|uniref:RNA binding protein n=1 Tax=Pristionchus pacificus TaxID=54126 RepID=A0A2A6BZX0_PRIPA|nr:hypothetical protein PRIPAC_72164 [Pristionchus pacificus]|eukprot:PDM71430.1 RNA binding protein [Pristionchus pacificus]